MTDRDPAAEAVIPLVEEQLRVDKHAEVTGRVRVHTTVNERVQRAEAELAREEVRVVRVPINRQVDVMPAIREEGDTVIYPVVEEVLVVEKRLVLKEEIRLVRQRHSERFQQDVVVRSTEATVERLPPGETS